MAVLAAEGSGAAQGLEQGLEPCLGQQTEPR